jgi:hypothetical protein
VIPKNNIASYWKIVSSLYVGVAVYRAPQEWLRSILLSGFALFFCVCCGVAAEFFSTRDTWLHVETAVVWMWGHAKTRHRIHKKTTNSTMQPAVGLWLFCLGWRFCRCHSSSSHVKQCLGR